MKKINPAILTTIWGVLTMFGVGFLLRDTNALGAFEFLYAIPLAVIIWWQDIIWRNKTNTK